MLTYSYKITTAPRGAPTRRMNIMTTLLSKRYDEMQVGDVVYFHGANVRIINIKRRPYTEEFYKNECTETISFEIEPADDEAVEILGNFYSHGWYGGVGCLKMYYRA